MENSKPYIAVLVDIAQPPIIDPSAPMVYGAKLILTIPNNLNVCNPEELLNKRQEVTLEKLTPELEQEAEYKISLRITELLKLTHLSYLSHLLSMEADALMNQADNGNAANEQPFDEDYDNSFFILPEFPDGLEKLITLKSSIENPNMDQGSIESQKAINKILWKVYTIFSLSPRFECLINHFRENNCQPHYKCLKFVVADNLLPLFDSSCELLWMYFIMTMLNTTNRIKLMNHLDEAFAYDIHNNENAEECSVVPKGG